MIELLGLLLMLLLIPSLLVNTQMHRVLHHQVPLKNPVRISVSQLVSVTDYERQNLTKQRNVLP